MNNESIKFGNKDYSLVPARLKKFREANPRSDVDTVSTINPDGSITFRARLVKDLADEFSAKATGTARYSEAEMQQPKAFEKLETISVGRALAMLGYLNNGQVATTEEMEEFEAYRLSKVDEAVEAVKKAEKRGDFEAILSKLSAEQQKQLTPVVRKRMKEIQDGNSNGV